jgi:hypothetical protein
MHIYYEYPNSSSAYKASSEIYDLNTSSIQPHGTYYAYSICAQTGSDPRCLVMYTDDEYFDTGSIFEGVSTLTNVQAIEQGYFVSGSPVYDDEGLD